MQQDGLEPRVSALEARVDELTDRVRASEQDAAAARVLAGAADRDTSDIRGELRDFRRATTASFNALREDMTDGFARVDEQFAQVNASFAEMRGRLDGAAAGQEHIAALLRSLIEKP